MTQNVRHGVKIESQAASAAYFYTVIRTFEKMYLFRIFKNYFSGLRARLKKRIFPHQKGYSLIPPVPGRPVNKNGTCCWLVQVHLRRQGLSSPSEGEGFTLPSEVEGENKVENENEEEQDEVKHRRLGQND